MPGISPSPNCNELSAFYRTPTGTKALHEMPQVMGEFDMPC